jgi:UrcA family protein
MTIQTNNQIRIAAAIALFAAFTAGAQAADVLQVHVKYADLNLNSKDGATVLYHRIRSAADLVCGIADTRDLGRLAAAKACAAHAAAEAVATVNAPALTVVHEARMGGASAARFAAIR